MVHPVPSPSPSAGSSSTGGHSYASYSQQRKQVQLNPNSQSFSFLQPDQMGNQQQSYHQQQQQQQASYDYPISNYNPSNSQHSHSHSHSAQSNGGGYYQQHQPVYPINNQSNWNHSHNNNKLWNRPSSSSAAASSSSIPYQQQQLSHHSPYYQHHQPQPQQQPPQPLPPSHRNSSNGIFLPLAHNGPHHLASPSHSPYLAAPPPPIPLQSTSTFSPQRPLPPATVHTPHIPTAPSLPVSPATPLPPPTTIASAATSFFPPPQTPPIGITGNPVSFATAPRLPPSQIQPPLPPNQQPPVPSAPTQTISQPPQQITSNDKEGESVSTPPTRRHRKSRLPAPISFPAITLATGVKTPTGFRFPDGLSIGYGVPKVKEDEKKEEMKADEVSEEKKEEEELVEKEEVKEREKEVEREVVIEEKKEEPEPAKKEDGIPTLPTTTTTAEEPSVKAEPSPSVEPASVAPVEESAPTSPPAPSVPAPKPASSSAKKSWADLVRPPPGSVPASSSTGITPISASLSSAPSAPQAPISSLLSALSAPPSHIHKPSPPLPRGLINNGNLCFANAILQALVYCGAFWETLRAVEQGSRADLRSGGQKGRSAVEAMIAFLAEFRNPSQPSSSTPFDPSTPNPAASSSTPSTSTSNASTVPSSPTPSSSRLASTSSSTLPSLSPTPIHDALSSNPRFDAMRRGTQEDAEEFLGFFLETLSEEVAEIVRKEEERIAKMSGKDKGKEKELPVEEEGWEEVGSKGRTATTRTTGETKESPITRIFGGKLRSVLRCPGQKDSVTIEAFQQLQLDIQPDHVRTIEDALLNITSPEPLPDYTTSRGLVTQEATKQVTLDELPPVLILHLKRFLYDEHVGTQKWTKKIGYGTQLRIDEKVVSPSRRGGAGGKEAGVARYELFGVVYHHGLQASGGHYTVAVRTAYHSKNWLELDDTHIRSLGPGEIAVNPDTSTGEKRRWEATAAMRDREGVFGAEEEHKGAYLLLYARVDDAEK